MDEYQMLQTQIEKLSLAKTANQRSIIEKGVLLWGGRLTVKVREVEGKLARQLTWLESNIDHPKQDERFDEWQALLRWYEQSCNLLASASVAGMAVAA